MAEHILENLTEKEVKAIIRGIPFYKDYNKEMFLLHTNRVEVFPLCLFIKTWRVVEKAAKEDNLDLDLEDFIHTSKTGGLIHGSEAFECININHYEYREACDRLFHGKYTNFCCSC